jgi:hypothetical protein
MTQAAILSAEDAADRRIFETFFLPSEVLIDAVSRSDSRRGDEALKTSLLPAGLQIKEREIRNNILNMTTIYSDSKAGHG